MSNPARLGRLRAARAESGFTLLEVIVALGLFALMTAAVVPMVITGTKAGMVAKLDTGARNLTQERFEVMRNLPFHVDAHASATTSPDLLDTYYRNLVAAADADSAGYVTSGARRPGEPTTGPFYRYVFNPVPGFGQYRQYIATQFLDAAGVAVTPPADYDSQVEAKDAPASMTVGVTVTTEWFAGSLSKSYTVFSQMGEGRAAPPTVTAVSRAAAFRITGRLGDRDLVLEAATGNIDGSTTTGATAGAAAQGAVASLTPGARVEGASASVAAPPESGATSDNDGSDHQLTDELNRTLVRIGPSSVDGVAASAANGEPSAGSSATPMQSVAKGSGGFFYTNRPNLLDNALGLSSHPVVTATDNSSGSIVATSRSWMKSTGGINHNTATHTELSTQTLAVLPTSFAPAGLLRVTLLSSAFDCVASAAARTATPTYSATLQYLRYDVDKQSYSYVDAGPLRQDNAVDPLAGINLTVGAGGVPVAFSDNRLVYLGEYVSGLSSQTSTTLAAAAAVHEKRLEANYPGMVSITTVPLRTNEPLSSVSLQLGVTTCAVEDNRA